MRRALLISAVLGAVALVPATASANHHFMKISEVHPGTVATPDSAFVELQSYEAGQNVLTGHQIVVKNMNGTNIIAFTFGSNPPNGQSQRTFLMGDLSVTGADEVESLAGVIPPAGGAVCFDAIDCVAWGNVTVGGLAALPSPAGAPVAVGGIPDGSSLTRSISPGCATLLESADDTNSSSADFSLTATPTPRPNSVTPTETECSSGGGGSGGGGGGTGDPGGGGSGGGGTSEPATTIDRGPKKKSKSKEATFVFSSPDSGVTFECSLDGKAFQACTSPQTYKRLKAKKHTFEVRAVSGGTADSSPATYEWTVKKPKRKKK